MTPRGRKILLCIATVAVALIGLAAFVPWPTWLIYNPSESAPRGWYVQRPVRALQPNTLVFARLPATAAVLADERGYLPRHLPILKRVGAIEGQMVCAENGLIRIGGRTVAIARSRDGRGRPLAPWRGCRALAHGEVFLFATRSQASFDSRYFGPVQREALLGEAIPLWTW